MASTKRHIVSFELSPIHYEALADEAATYGLDSHHKRARSIVLDHLSSRDVDELSEFVTSLESQVAYLSELVRRLTYCVIVHAAGQSSENANEWIRKNMPPRPDA